MNKPQIKLRTCDPVPKVMCIYEGREVTAQRVRIGRTTGITVSWGKICFTMKPFDFDEVKYEFPKWFVDLVLDCRAKNPAFGK